MLWYCFLLLLKKFCTSYWNAEHPGFDMFFLGFLGLMSRVSQLAKLVNPNFSVMWATDTLTCIFPIINPGPSELILPLFFSKLPGRRSTLKFHETKWTPRNPWKFLEHHHPHRKMNKHLFLGNGFSDPEGWFLGGSSAIVLHQSSYWNQTALVEFVSHRLGCEARSSRCGKSWGNLQAFVEKKAQTVV